MESSGKLSLIATPIGNLEDITLRALRVLKEAEVIACEDTRRTRMLLSHYDIHGAELVSFHAFNEHGKCRELLRRVAEEGCKVAMVSDAGTPAVADPGFLIAREAVALGIELEVVPGVSAVTFAVAMAGLPVEKFAFYGFVPVKSGRKRKFIEEMLAEDKSVIFFESPHRISGTVKLLAELGPERELCVIREATKLHEEVIRGTASHLAEGRFETTSWKGEFVVVLGRDNSKKSSDEENL